MSRAWCNWWHQHWSAFPTGGGGWCLDGRDGFGWAGGGAGGESGVLCGCVVEGKEGGGGRTSKSIASRSCLLLLIFCCVFSMIERGASRSRVYGVSECVDQLLTVQLVEWTEFPCEMRAIFLTVVIIRCRFLTIRILFVVRRLLRFSCDYITWLLVVWGCDVLRGGLGSQKRRVGQSRFGYGCWGCGEFSHGLVIL